MLRDLDVLRELTRQAGATVCSSLPTVDAEIWRCTEPGTPPPEQRLRVMERLVTAGVRAGVLMAPLLPGLSADPEQIACTVRAAAEHGARFIGASLLHLDADIRAVFLGFLEQEYPDLLDGYERLYGTKYAPKRYQTRVERRVGDARATAGYSEDHHRHIEALPESTQLGLPLLTPSR